MTLLRERVRMLERENKDLRDTVETFQNSQISVLPTNGPNEENVRLMALVRSLKEKVFDLEEENRSLRDSQTFSVSGHSTRVMRNDEDSSGLLKKVSETLETICLERDVFVEEVELIAVRRREEAMALDEVVAGEEERGRQETPALDASAMAGPEDGLEYVETEIALQATDILRGNMMSAESDFRRLKGLYESVFSRISVCTSLIARFRDPVGHSSLAGINVSVISYEKLSEDEAAFVISISIKASGKRFTALRVYSDFVDLHKSLQDCSETGIVTNNWSLLYNAHNNYFWSGLTGLLDISFPHMSISSTSFLNGDVEKETAYLNVYMRDICTAKTVCYR